jgi:hypothetical protein
VHGALINARMGLNTWAAFAGTDQDAMVAGDVAMLAHEVTPVLKALRANGWILCRLALELCQKPFSHRHGTPPGRG